MGRPLQRWKPLFFRGLGEQVKDGPLKLIQDNGEQDANWLLEDSLNQDFQTVIILGFKDSKIYIKNSELHGRMALIGALEAAKNHLLNSDE